VIGFFKQLVHIPVP